METASDMETAEALERSDVGSSKPLWETGDQNQKILDLSYLGLGLLLCYVLGHFFKYIMDLFFDYVLVDSSMALALERSPLPLEFVVSIALTGLALVLVRRHPKANGFGLEVVAEMKKVTWSPWDVTWKSTIAVLVTVAICAAILGVFDGTLNKLAEMWLR